MREFGPRDKVDNARIALITEFPFYGSIFLQMNVFESDLNKTAWTDGISIGYNLEYTASLEHEQIIGLFVHECKHVILKHHLRQHENSDFKDNHKKYNVACDYALNPTIKHTRGMDIHPDWMYNSKWDDEFAEVIFYELKDKDMPQSDSQMPGEVLPFPGNGDPDSAQPGKGNQPGKAVRVTMADIDAESQKIDQWVRSAAFKAQGCGKLDGNVESVIRAATAETVDWRDELFMVCEDITRNDYTWARPNQRFVQQGIYLPTLHGNKTVDMIFFVDCSGSVDDDQLSTIAGEIREIVAAFSIRVIVVYWDTGFRDMEIFDAGDVMEPDFSLNIKGRGGTDFKDCWEWLYENQMDFDIDPKAMIFFSDMECDSYDDMDPGMPVIWCQVPYYSCSGSVSFNSSYLNYLPEYGKLVRTPVYRKE
jgi:predicted metal-dependent peptidase